METTDNIDGSVDAVADSLILAATEKSEPESDNPEMESEEAQEELSLGDEDESESIEDNDESENVAEEQLDDEGQSAPEMYAVKVDGEEVQVSMDDLKRSYSGQAYIQKGMQEAAEAKKQAEEVYGTLLQERQQMQQLLSQMQSGEMLLEPKPPSSEMFKNDPIGYMEAKMQYDEAIAEYDKQQAVIEQVNQQQSQQMQAARQVHLREEMVKLTQAIPEFADPEKAVNIKEKLVSGGMKLGYSEAELVDVADHRALVTLYKAIKYDEIVNGKDKAVQKSSNARKMIKPGAKKPASSSKTKAREEAVARMKKTGNIDDVANFILS